MPRISLKLQYFAANLAVLWLALFFYRTNRYYLNFLNTRIDGVLLTQSFLLWLAIAYTFGGFVYYLRKREPEPSHAYLALWAFLRGPAGAGFCLSCFSQTSAP